MKIQLQSLRVINCGPLRGVCIHACIHFATDGIKERVGLPEDIQTIIEQRVLA